MSVFVPAFGVKHRHAAERDVISIVIPNDNSQVAKAADWKPYRVSARSIESLTGLNLLSDVAVTTQNVIETQVDTQ